MKTKIGKVISINEDQVIEIRSGNHIYKARATEFKLNDSVKFTWEYLPSTNIRSIKTFYKQAEDK